MTKAGSKKGMSGARTGNRAPGTQPRGVQYPTFEFHILKSARKLYDIDDALFSLTGNVVFINFHAVRILAYKMNSRRDLGGSPHLAVRTGALNAMGLIDEIYHYIVQLYERTVNPGVFQRALDYLEQTIGNDGLQELLAGFVGSYPPTSVYRGEETPESHLRGGTMGKSNEEIAAEEILHIYFANFNPGFTLFRELFDDEVLRKIGPYDSAIAHLDKFFLREKKFGPNNEDIFSLLRAPILASPHSLEGQLAFIRTYWGALLPDSLLERMTLATDLMKEDLRFIPGGGPAPTHVPRYDGEESLDYLRSDEERFTPDIDWMPNVVLLAKNTYVWLDQLSKKYRRSIRRLDQIPDEELDQLARWHFTGLWLIGIWERSRSSQRIKQLTGNPEAVASAYSLYDYDIAGDLGGEEGLWNLRHRAWQRGIRLAGDMVPNHVGLYSRWVVEHPEYFIQSPYPPFPNYRFTGENLSENPSVEVRIEDGYWSRSDAAVVFQRIDKTNGHITYIYHGNDGTSMPWNDTAQLDFLNGEVREAVVQSIFHVARKFSIIRFDAAMVLAKKHFQRLWYPEPGTGGAIPSRSDHAMARRDFNAAFPREFWREVVDRINAEMPNTLLLAEAFWLLEGYFVRTLGMHRVYNSAFMHMLMKEENAKYRELIRNTLHYNPEILKRYVNFMSNPDERTAIDQFGKGDKYFGIATMMVTLPGLPMFAHGQIEGYSEKYGMEYYRAYYDEYPDDDLIRRHEREIFPLLNKRHLFSQVTHFEMYDFVTGFGSIDENVFAYSNQHYSERAFVCFHNRYAETEGFIQVSSGKIAREGSGSINRTTLAQKFGFKNEQCLFYIFKDSVTGLEFLRSGATLSERGFFLRLRAFEYHVFLDIREVWDGEGIFARIAEQIGTNGIPDIWQAAKRLRLEDVHNAFVGMFLEPAARISLPVRRVEKDLRPGEVLPERFLENLKGFIRAANQIAHINLNDDRIQKAFTQSAVNVTKAFGDAGLTKEGPVQERPQNIFHQLLSDPKDQMVLVLWLLLRTFTPDEMRRIYEELWLDEPLRRVFQHTGLQDVDHEIILMHVLTDLFCASGVVAEKKPLAHIADMIRIDRSSDYLQLHEHEGVRYYHKESFERLMAWFVFCRWITGIPYISASAARDARDEAVKFLEMLCDLSVTAGYHYDVLMSSLRKSASAVPRRNPGGGLR